jgi:hypothetical protein
MRRVVGGMGYFVYMVGWGIPPPPMNKTGITPGMMTNEVNVKTLKIKILFILDMIQNGWDLRWGITKKIAFQLSSHLFKL